MLAFLLAVAAGCGGGELTSVGPPEPGSWRVTLVEELRELYPDSNPDTIGADALTMHTPRGVPLGVHLLVRGGDPAAPLTFHVTRGQETVDAARWFRMIDVPVEENTGLVSRTERWDGATNPHVIRRAPFRVFEALAPITSPLVVDASLVALRLEIPVPTDAAVGEERFTVEIARGEAGSRLALEVIVHSAVVPPIGADTFRYTNWFSTAQIASRHGVEIWSEEFWTLLGRYAALMAHGRQNVFWLRWSDVFVRDDAGEPQLDAARLERYVRVFDDAGLYWIEGAPFASRPGGDWSSPELHISLTGLAATSDEGGAALVKLAASLYAALCEHGWEERWLQHLADEPTDTNAADYRALAALFREAMGGIPIVEATMSRELVGAVDVWCPQVQKYQAHRDFFDARRAAGDRLWIYTCLAPGGAWVNRLLDLERLRAVWIGWGAAAYELEGFLHWGFNHYHGDPFAQSVVDHPAAPGGKNRLPAGDTHVVYPGPDGPWSSQRFEAHRIGLEDGELLRQLFALDREEAERIVARVFRAFDDYETDVALYLDARREVLEALER